MAAEERDQERSTTGFEEPSDSGPIRMMAGNAEDRAGAEYQVEELGLLLVTKGSRGAITAIPTEVPVFPTVPLVMVTQETMVSTTTMGIIVVELDADRPTALTTAVTMATRLTTVSNSKD